MKYGMLIVIAMLSTGCGVFRKAVIEGEGMKCTVTREKKDANTVQVMRDNSKIRKDLGACESEASGLADKLQSCEFVRDACLTKPKGS